MNSLHSRLQEVFCLPFRFLFFDFLPTANAEPDAAAVCFMHPTHGSFVQAPAVPALGAAVAIMALAVSCPMAEAYALSAPTSFLGPAVGGGIHGC